MKKTILVLAALAMILAGSTLTFAKNEKPGDRDDKKCNWSSRWDKNPETFRLDPGQVQVFTLIVSNNDKEKTCKFEFIPDGSYVKFDPATVEIAAKQSANIKVTVTMPPNPNNSEKANFRFWIKPGDSDKKEMKFGIHYTRKLCLFNAKWEKEYGLEPLKPGETRTQVLIISNPSKTDPVSIKVISDAKNIEFLATAFTINAGETFKLTVKITQPEKGDSWKTVWLFKLAAECGLKKEFSIRAVYPGFCLFEIKWEKEPSIVLEPGKDGTFNLVIKNLNPLESLDLTVVSDNPKIKFSATSFTIAKGESYKLTIIVTQPEKSANPYVAWKFTIKTSCGTTKEVVFKTKYSDDSKKDCKFEVTLPPGQDNKKMQRGKDGQIIIHVKNTSSNAIEFKVGTSVDFAKADPATFTLDSGKLNVVKINISVPKDFDKSYLELQIKVKAGCGGEKTLKLKLAVTK